MALTDFQKVLDEYRSRLNQLEKIIIPFLTKLYQTGNKEYILT